ncbi:MAG TPA: cytochrome-c oxidase, cbb3-type subunit III [Burkholderiales bacterium]|jgi:cytochrome c oxidase cbb3-type subunit 3|nr:cytochrome-c oxidase, cbb3-type subunit III [Burkholderiales bacterium]
MSDFLSGFWGYFIAIGTLGGIAFCVVLLTATNKRRGASKKPELHDHVWDEDLQEYNNPLPLWWMGLFYLTIIFGVGYLVLYPGLGEFKGTLGWTSSGEHTDEQQQAKARFAPIFEKYAQQDVRAVAAIPEARATGQRLFLTYCAQCHGSDSGGAKGFPNLTDKDWLYGNDPASIRTSIAEGRNGVMPAFGQMLTSEEVNEVSYYVLSLSGFPSDSVKIYGGRKVFQSKCVACHGADGKGNHAIGAPNLTDKIWLHGGSSKDVIETVSNGRSSRMPAHQDILDESKIHLLSAYVYSLSADTEKLVEAPK